MSRDKAAGDPETTVQAIASGILGRHRGSTILDMQDGGALGIRDGFIPRLVTYTAEDRAAKGLRSFRDQKGESHPPLHFAALELVQDERFVVLMAGRGEGKTSLAIDLALHLAGDIVGDAEFGIAGLIRSIPRNEEGDERPVAWSLGRTLPVILSAAEGDTWDTMLSRGAPGLRTLLNEPGWPGSTGVLFIVDGLEHLGAAGPGLLREIADFAAGHAGIRVVGLGAPDPVNTWPLPEGASKYTLLPLLHAQRQHFAHDVLAPRGLGLSPAALSPLAAHPGLFSLALNISGSAASREELLDLWLTATTNDPDAVARSGFDSLSDVLSDDGTSGYRGFLLDLLAARHLASQPLALAADLYRRSPRVWASALPSLAARAAGSPARLAELVGQLMSERTDDCLMGALLIADAVPPDSPSRTALQAALRRTIEEGRLSPAHRARAGRVLAAWGDPRDLEAMAAVPGGTFVMGSSTHPNSTPPHAVEVADFRIGLYPVTNARYRAFVEATGRHWASIDGLQPDRANAPAVDLTWHDATAFCAWITGVWRAEGRIHRDEVARLPTEPEWERAARGDQPDAGDAIVYPWQGGWGPDFANSEATGFNDTCTVGLFPAGRSPYGCYDMAGQVWEWATTLWGDDMATPSFAYPYANDGREAEICGPLGAPRPAGWLFLERRDQGVLHLSR